MGVYTFSAIGDYDQFGFQYAVNKIEQITIPSAPARYCTMCKYFVSGSNGVVRKNYVAFEGDQTSLIATVSIDKYVWDGVSSYVFGQTYTGTYNLTYDSVTDITLVNGTVGTGASMWGNIPPTTANCYTTDNNENMYRLAREYFDTPTSGSGTATVEIDIEGEQLTFESQMLGKTITRFIDDDAEVDMEE